MELIFMENARLKWEVLPMEKFAEYGVLPMPKFIFFW
jgi:hypothetical protein